MTGAKCESGAAGAQMTRSLEERDERCLNSGTFTDDLRRSALGYSLKWGTRPSARLPCPNDFGVDIVASKGDDKVVAEVKIVAKNPSTLAGEVLKTIVPELAACRSRLARCAHLERNRPRPPQRPGDRLGERRPAAL